MQERRKSYLKRSESERASGDLLFYFILHNIVSILIFFFFAWLTGIHTSRDFTLAFVFSSAFWELAIFNVFPLYVISAIAGRITAYYIIKGYNIWQKRAIKRWSELNREINKMGLRFLITALFTSFFYSLGVVALL